MIETTMTKQRLANIQRLRSEIEVTKERIHLLRTVAAYGTKQDTPKGKGGFATDRTGNNAAKIADLEIKLNKRIDTYLTEIAVLEDYIASIPDSELRQIFALRFIHGKSWLSIAFKLGYYDEQIPRKKVDRWLHATRI